MRDLTDLFITLDSTRRLSATACSHDKSFAGGFNLQREGNGSLRHFDSPHRGDGVPGASEPWLQARRPGALAPRCGDFLRAAGSRVSVSVVAARAEGARRLVASTWHRRGDIAENPRARKLRPLKRPEGRAPAQIIVGALNTYQATFIPTRREITTRHKRWRCHGRSFWWKLTVCIWLGLW